MKKFNAFLSALLVLAGSLFAQFDDDHCTTSAQGVFDRFDAAIREPEIEPVIFYSPVSALRSRDVLDEEAEDDDCDLEPEVARAWRKADIADDEDCPEYLGRLSANPYATDSTANPYSSAGNPYSSKSVNNPYGNYGSPYSSQSARNPYATDAPKIVAQDGTYLGKLSDNPYDPDSVANPYGRYGSPYSSTSIKNPYSTYGSPYSSQSPNNPYATQAPLLFGD